MTKMNLSPLNVCIVQSDLVWKGKKENLKHFEKLFSQLNHKADIIVLPEMFNTAFVMNPPLIAERMGGDSTIWLQQQASQSKAVIVGSICIEEEGNYFNRFMAVFPDGRIFQYDKRHLFRLADETAYFSKGNHSLIFEIKGWKIKPLVCYDLRFPVWSKNNFKEGTFEYDCLIYVANWPEFRNYVWKSLLVARAMENQAYVIGVNRIGLDGNNIPHTGDSMILDPKGKSLYTAPSNTEIMHCHTLDYPPLAKLRNDIEIGPDWDSFSIQY